MQRDSRSKLYGYLKSYPVKNGTQTVPEWKNISKDQAAQMGKDLHLSSQEEASVYLDVRSAEQYNTKRGSGSCPKCLGKGYIQNPETRQLKTCPVCKGASARSALPKEIRSAAMNFEPTTLYQKEAVRMIDTALSDFMNKKEARTVLITDPGDSGKTGLASRAAMKAEGAGYSVCYISWHDLLGKRSENQYRNQNKIDKKMQTVPVLVLENFVNPFSDKQVEMFNTLLDVRNQKGLLTIITSTLPKGLLLARQGGETLSRSIEDRCAELQPIEYRVFDAEFKEEK